MPKTSVYPIASCVMCGMESSGRCPTCRRNLCMEHFGYEDHEPCAADFVTHAAQRVCYVCGVQVRPEQWSTSHFAHYIDSGKCRGCGRYVCDNVHTRLRDEQVALVNDSLRSQRYHTIMRYCDVCAPIRFLGGLFGLGRIIAGILVATVLVLLILRFG